jgi:hypothetical protein
MGGLSSPIDGTPTLALCVLAPLRLCVNPFVPAYRFLTRAINEDDVSSSQGV